MRKLIFIALLTILTLLAVRAIVSADEPIQEPVRDITNCVYGDTLTKDVCAKFKQTDEITERTKTIKPGKPFKSVDKPVYDGK